MSLCWQVIGHNATGDNTQGKLITPNGGTTTGYVCGDTVSSIEITVNGGYYAGCLAYVLDINGSYDTSGNSGISAGAYTITQVLASSSLAGNCSSSCKPVAYDCINGSCTSSPTYGTPGDYPTLAQCQASCGGITCPNGQSCFDPNNLPCPVCPTGRREGVGDTQR